MQCVRIWIFSSENIGFHFQKSFIGSNVHNHSDETEINSEGENFVSNNSALPEQFQILVITPMKMKIMNNLNLVSKT